MKISKPKRVIRFCQELFWDVNPKKISSKTHARYVIERILDFEKGKEVTWIANYYSKN